MHSETCFRLEPRSTGAQQRAVDAVVRIEGTMIVALRNIERTRTRSSFASWARRRRLGIQSIPGAGAGPVRFAVYEATDLLLVRTGYPIATRLREKHLFAASLLSADPAPSIIDLALAVGCCEAGHFARQFFGRFGITPSGWRAHVVSGSFAGGESANG